MGNCGASADNHLRPLSSATAAQAWRPRMIETECQASFFTALLFSTGLEVRASEILGVARVFSSIGIAPCSFDKTVNPLI
jgi:hypothetical protein